MPINQPFMAKNKRATEGDRREMGNDLQESVSPSIKTRAAATSAQQTAIISARLPTWLGIPVSCDIRPGEIPN
jgi:hypothetical protein